MLSHPYVLFEVARLHREELLRQAARERMASQLPRLAAHAPTWSPRSAFRPLAYWLSRTAAAGAT